MNLTAEHLRKSFGSQHVLSDCSFTVPEKKTLCVMGPSGSGKTTLLRLLAGLELPDSGRIRYPDGTCRPPSPIGFVFQENRLCPGFDAAANIRLAAPHLSGAQIEAELLKVGLNGSSRKPVRDYSGGMQRRVAIVRALAADASLILLDEPLKGFDHALFLQVRDYIRDSLSGRTAVLVTHDPQEAEFFGKELLCL